MHAWFSKMQLDASLAACDVSVSASRRRRLVADTSYDVNVFMSPVTVDTTTLIAALENLPRKVSPRRPRKPFRRKSCVLFPDYTLRAWRVSWQTPQLQRMRRRWRVKRRHRYRHLHRYRHPSRNRHRHHPLRRHRRHRRYWSLITTIHQRQEGSGTCAQR